MERATEKINWGLVHLYIISLIIAAVSTYDVYTSVMTAQIIEETELNPITRWVIHIDKSFGIEDVPTLSERHISRYLRGIAIMVSARMFSTIFGVVILHMVYHHKHKRWYMYLIVTVLGSVWAIEQLAVFGYLVLN